MQFKPVPEPPASLDQVVAVRAALPAEADPEVDCCARVIERTDVETRAAAADWISFLRALELATRDREGFRREGRREFDVADLREAFLDRVYGVEALIEILERADVPLPAEAVAERYLEARPAAGRDACADRADDTERERVDRLLGWAVLLRVLERTDDGYRPI